MSAYIFEPKPFVDEPFYTVAQAMRLTGFTATKFRYEPNKIELDKRGADVSDRIWKIPRHALIDMGWLDPDAPNLDELEQEVASPPLRRSTARIIELAEKVTALENELAVAHAVIKAKDAEIANLSSLLRK